jgi:hypothetical protein
MFDVLFNGPEYLIAPIGSVQGWHAIDCASTIEEGHAKSKKDWDHFWKACGIIPSRPLRVTVA